MTGSGVEVADMSIELSIVDQWFLPLAFVILGLIAGFLFNRTIPPHTEKFCTLE